MHLKSIYKTTKSLILKTPSGNTNCTLACTGTHTKNKVHDGLLRKK